MNPEIGVTTTSPGELGSWAPAPGDATYVIDARRQLIPRYAIDRALRALHQDILTNGVTANQVKAWRDDHHWFPHLGNHPAVTALTDHLPPEWQEGTPAEGAQIVLQFPSDEDPDQARAFEQAFHVDTLPHWPAGKTWHRIVAIPLTRWRHENGAVRFKIGDRTLTPGLNPGDALAFPGHQPHGPGPNLTGEIRYGLYFRWE